MTEIDLNTSEEAVAYLKSLGWYSGIRPSGEIVISRGFQKAALPRLKLLDRCAHIIPNEDGWAIHMTDAAGDPSPPKMTLSEACDRAIAVLSSEANGGPPDG